MDTTLKTVVYLKSVYFPMFWCFTYYDGVNVGYSLIPFLLHWLPKTKVLKLGLRKFKIFSWPLKPNIWELHLL